MVAAVAMEVVTAVQEAAAMLAARATGAAPEVVALVLAEEVEAEQVRAAEQPPLVPPAGEVDPLPALVAVRRPVPVLPA